MGHVRLSTDLEASCYSLSLYMYLYLSAEDDTNAAAEDDTSRRVSSAQHRESSHWRQQQRSGSSVHLLESTASGGGADNSTFTAMPPPPPSVAICVTGQQRSFGEIQSDIEQTLFKGLSPATDVFMVVPMRDWDAKVHPTRVHSHTHGKHGGKTSTLFAEIN